MKTKIKTKIKSDLVIFGIVVIVFLFCAFYISTTIQSKDPTTINNSDGGLSVFYKTLKELKLPVETTLKPISESNIEDIQIVAQGGDFNITDAEVLDWVDKGGTLVYLTDDKITPFQLGLTPEVKGNINIYQEEKGMIIVAETSFITNKSLLKDSEEAYNILDEISSHSYRNIVFSESHFFSQTKEKSLWDYIPLEGKYIIYQLVLIAMAFFYYKGRRFGKVIPLYEEVERTENEYLYSTASLYRLAGCWDIILENYYKSLLREIRSYSENFLEYWERENLPALSKAKAVYTFMENKNKKIKRKEYIEMINTMEQLKDILKKRRAVNWKTLKNNQ